MQYYRCKCGEAETWGSMSPDTCQGCSKCGTTLASRPDGHSTPKPHNWKTGQVETDEGPKPLTSCAWCGVTKHSAEPRHADCHDSTTTGETQSSVSSWISDTFGTSGSNGSVAARANEEMAELLSALAADDSSPAAAGEAADVLILLYRLAARLGFDLHEEVSKKMGVNRQRAWRRNGTTGQFHHERGAEAAAEVQSEGADGV